jgi:hypothetical protein
MSATLTPPVSTKEPRVVETCRGTAHGIRSILISGTRRPN